MITQADKNHFRQMIDKKYIDLNFRVHYFFKKFVQKEHHAKFFVLPQEAMTR